MSQENRFSPAPAVGGGPRARLGRWPSPAAVRRARSLSLPCVSRSPSLLLVLLEEAHTGSLVLEHARELFPAAVLAISGAGRPDDVGPEGQIRRVREPREHGTIL